MAFIETDLRQIARTKLFSERQYNSRMNYENMILLENEKTSKKEYFDIFLSHRKIDEELIIGIKKKLEDEYKYSVYVDWINDPKLDRNQVDKVTAQMLRMRMLQSRCLMYVHTENTADSKWMPWELGYMDGHKPNKCTILPVIANANGNQDAYKQQEYLNLYPPTKEEVSYNTTLYVHEDSGKVSFKDWINRNNVRVGKEEEQLIKEAIRKGYLSNSTLSFV